MEIDQVQPEFLAEDALVEAWFGGRTWQQLIQQFESDGYLIFENVLDRDSVAVLREELRPYLEHDLTGRNNFEGVKSNRVYGMLDKSPKFAELALHPLALGFAEAELGASCLLSACLAIQLKPGESAQPWHFDDAHLEIPRPRPAYGISAFWAIDEMHEENGATEIIPGSHKWSGQEIDGSITDQHLSEKDQPETGKDPGARADSTKVLMKPGSLMLAKGTLWHRGGANTSDKPRLIITPQYCPGWSRQLENMLLAVTPENVARLPERAKELIGYNIHPPFMGYVDGMHPLRALKRP